MSIAKIVANIEGMQALFEESGFKNVRLFKGFADRDEKTFYLVTILGPGEEAKDYLSCVRKTRQLAENLQALLGCYVHISRESAVDSDALEFINRSGNSVNLSELLSKETLQAELESYFGSSNWQFNKTDPYAENEPEIQESVPQGSIYPIAPLFTSPVEKSRSTNVGGINERFDNLLAQVVKCKNENSEPKFDLLLKEISELKELVVEELPKSDKKSGLNF